MNGYLLYYLIGIILGLFALVGWILLFIRKSKAAKTKAKLIENQNSLSEAQNELHELHETEGIKAKFFASLSNELRTPLNSILGFSELLLTSDLTPEQEEYAKTVQSSGNELLHVMSNLIDYSHIHARTLVGSKTHFDLAQLLHQLCLEIETLAKRKEILFRTEGDYNKSVILNTDKSYLYTLLYNLLANAVKFTDTGAVTFRVKHQLEPGKGEEALLYHITIEVEDTGIGIPEEDLPSIYSAFYQVERTGEGTRGGLGLGLAVVQKLVAFFDGSIEYEPLVPGSKFTVKISLPGVGKGLAITDRKRSLRMSGQKSSVGESFYKHHILIAEDMPSNSRLLEVMLDKMGHTYDVATNGQEAVVAAKNTLYDVILMDIQMPLLSGKIASKMIRAGKMGEKNINTPIVALTSLASEQEKKELDECGMNRCLSKPVNVDQLRSVLTEIARERMKG
jgi:signal transduction histidine kinase/ActR/RegA family two-component response regulator